MNSALGLWKCADVKGKDDTGNWRRWNVIATPRDTAIHPTVMTGAVHDPHHTDQDDPVHCLQDVQDHGRAHCLEIVASLIIDIKVWWNNPCLQPLSACLHRMHQHSMNGAEQSSWAINIFFFFFVETLK